MGSPSTELEYPVSPGQRITVQVTRKGYEQMSDGVVEIGPDDREASVVIRMAATAGPNATLVLRPRDSLGRAIPSLKVLRRVTPGRASGEDRETVGGSIEVSLEPGGHQLVLCSPGEWKPLSQSLVERELTVNLSPGERRVVDVEMTVGGWIRVLDFRGKRAEIRAAPAGEKLRCAYTKKAPDGNGHLLRNGAPLRPGVWILERQREGQPPVRREVEVHPEAVSEVRF